MQIQDILNQHKRGKGYFRSSWSEKAFIQMSYTYGIYMLYKVEGEVLTKTRFDFTQDDMQADDWEVANLCELEYRLLSFQEQNKKEA